MPFTTFDKVQSLLPEDVQIDDTTTPTKAQVESYLPGLDGALNVAIATGGGSVPIVDASMLAHVELLERQEAAYMVMQARGATRLKESVWQDYHNTWTYWLDKLSTPGAAAAAAPTSTVGSPSSVTDIVPRLTKDKIY